MNRMIFEALKQRPRNTWRDWLVFVMMLVFLVPILILMLILLPIFLLYQVIKWKFWAKNQKTIISPMGLMINERGHWRQILWPQIERGEVWLQDGKEVPVLRLRDGEDVVLFGMTVGVIQQALQGRSIPFNEQTVVVS